jgi:hypothetical protein
VEIENIVTEAQFTVAVTIAYIENNLTIATYRKKIQKRNKCGTYFCCSPLVFLFLAF